jgi:hypothetical protein
MQDLKDSESISKNIVNNMEPKAVPNLDNAVPKLDKAVESFIKYS